MNKTQLLDYLHQCLAEGRRHVPRDSLIELANGLAARILATRGLRAELTEGDKLALDRQWGQPGLADNVASTIDRKKASLDLEGFVTKSIAASLSVGNDPTGEDAEQAARVRLLAESSLALQAARDLSISDMALDKYIADIAAGLGLPPASQAGEPLKAWLAETIQYLRGYNPYQYEDEADFEITTILDEQQPSMLADWVRQSRPFRGSNEADHELLEQRIEALEHILEGLPERIADLRRQGKPTPTVAAAPIATIEPLQPSVASPQIASKAILATGDVLANKRKQDGAWRSGTANQARKTYELLARFLFEEHGVVTFAEFQQWHLERFDEFLRQVYRYYGQSSRLRSASIAELREFSAKQPIEMRGLDVATRTRHMGAIAQLLEHISNTEDIDPKLKPSAYMGKKTGRARDKRSIPADDKMAELFHAPVFVGCRSFKHLNEPGPHTFHRAAYFGPMLAHYQGMRREEYCGLAVEDIIVDNGELPYIHVCKNSIRDLKNAQSKRNLALHPELVRLGFLDYVKRVGELGFYGIFSDLHNPAIDAAWGNRFYKELEPIGRRLGISPHQIRHFFNNELKQKRVSKEFRADMLGHVGDSETTERYADPITISLQMEDLLKIELRTAHLQPQPIRLLPWVEAKQTPPWARPDRTKAAKAKKAAQQAL